VVEDVEEIASRLTRKPLCDSELRLRRQIDPRSAESVQGPVCGKAKCANSEAGNPKMKSFKLKTYPLAGTT